MHVNLPKVKLQYRQELQEALTSMGEETHKDLKHLCFSVTALSVTISVFPTGLGSLFSGPDLSGISDHPLKVGSVRHASTVELSEKGVEASAATVVTTVRSISIFSVNSPFLFALVDDASLVPLFMGIVTNPAPDNDRVLNDDPLVNRTLSDQPVTVDSNHSDSLCAERAACSAPIGENVHTD